MRERYVVHIIKKCNMLCVYCYEEDKTSEYTWDEVKALLDNIVKYNKDKEFEIEYLGGEPLLAFDIIKQATEYLENIPSINVAGYMITTNGTILTDDIIKWLQDNPKVHWESSMDGNSWMNQLRIFKNTRKNSHDIVLRNHNILINSIDPGRVSVHMVIHPYNVASLYKGILHLYNNGVRSIGVGTIESTMTIDDDYCDRFIRELDKVSKDICDNKLPGLYIDLLNFLKPKTDNRCYIRDESGKIIAESYGRTENDLTSEDVYNSKFVDSPVGRIIENIREIVYKKHQERLKCIKG